MPCEWRGHDAQDIARIAPIGMIFVQAWAVLAIRRANTPPLPDITNGVNVLMRVVLAIDAGKLDL